jgi:hypothetical protein
MEFIMQRFTDPTDNELHIPYKNTIKGAKIERNSLSVPIMGEYNTNYYNNTLDNNNYDDDNDYGLFFDIDDYCEVPVAKVTVINKPFNMPKKFNKPINRIKIRNMLSPIIEEPINIEYEHTHDNSNNTNNTSNCFGYGQDCFQTIRREFYRMTNVMRKTNTIIYVSTVLTIALCFVSVQVII